MQAIGALTVAGGWTKPVATCNSHGGLESATTNAEIFDSVTEKWSSTGSLNIARAGNNVFGTLLDGRVLYGGGRTPSPADRTVRTQSSEVYDPATATWTRVGDMQSSHTGGHAVTLQNGRVLAVGGGPRFRAAELYTPDGEQSAAGTIGDMPSDLLFACHWHPPAPSDAASRALTERGPSFARRA